MSQLVPDIGRIGRFSGLVAASPACYTRNMEKHSPLTALSEAETRRRLVELGALAKLAPTAEARIELNRLADRLATRGGISRS